ncbi:uncharacterized protein I206_100403 [Kwoniella pini CBS 10737]|uniref:D-isomer specific 2-hydroxyacid dehydrogenase NAD-binding domain-containing protein n=1 Tax=Kwoniella pini CBS 10737 TaxID=1296096 RepID=A0AAJ8MLG3_9TREE
MSKILLSGYELIVNPEDAAPKREWVLKHLADPEVGAACIMHNHIDVKAAHARGIKIGHTPGVLNDAGESTPQWPSLPWAPFVLCGHSISHPGLTIGFLGFGRISQAAVERLIAFTNKTEPANIIYTSSRRRENQDEIDTDFSKRYGVQVKRVEKDELATNADILIVLCDLNPSTKDLVNKDFLAKMKPSSILVNVARAMKGGPLLAEVKA